MQFEFPEGHVYLYDPAKMTVATAMAIKSYTGLGLKSWEEAIQDMDPPAIQGLYFAVKAQNGEPCELASLEFPLLEFMRVFGEARLAEITAQIEAAEREEKANPKGGSGRSGGKTRKPTQTSAGPGPSTSSS